MVCHFDCLHDMGDPVGAARHTRESLKDDGHWLLVEPFANDNVADDLNPIGRVFYSASTLICTPASLSQEVGGRAGSPGRRSQTQGGSLQARVCAGSTALILGQQGSSG
jgi:hypothetical protein